MKNKHLEKYPDNFKVRALINLIPHIGGALDILLTEKGAKWREERINKLLSELDAKIEDVKSNGFSDEKINQKFESEEFYDLLIQAMNSSIRTRHSQKISYYSNILLNQIVLDHQTEFSSELMIATLDNLTIDEINYLTELFNNQNKIELRLVLGRLIYQEKYQDWIRINKKIANNGEELPEDCLFPFNVNLIWKLLSDKNLVNIDGSDQFGSFDYSYSAGLRTSGQIKYSEKVIYSISEFGEQFIKWIIMK